MLEKLRTLWEALLAVRSPSDVASLLLRIGRRLQRYIFRVRRRVYHAIVPTSIQKHPRLISRILRRCAKPVPRIFVETGTRHAETAVKMTKRFALVHTIELSVGLYSKTLKKYGHIPNLVFHQGDSPEVLKRLVDEIEEPAVFFLDAHWYQGAPAEVATENKFPLWQELEVLKKRRWSDVIIVDDVQAFGKSEEGRLPEWRSVSLESILDYLGKEQVRDAEIMGYECVIWMDRA